MLCTFDVSYSEIWQNLKNAGWWFFAVVLVWIPIYAINAWSWRVIINNGNNGRRLPFWLVMKYTISGYALNYVTPRRRAIPDNGADSLLRHGESHFIGHTVRHDAHLFAFHFLGILHWAVFNNVFQCHNHCNGNHAAHSGSFLLFGNLLFHERLSQRFGNENVESIHAHSGFTTKSTEVRGGQTRNRGTHRLTDSRTPPSEQTHVLSVAFS